MLGWILTLERFLENKKPNVNNEAIPIKDLNLLGSSLVSKNIYTANPTTIIAIPINFGVLE